MKRFVAFIAILAFASCGTPMVSGPFFEMPMPRMLQLAETSADFIYSIVLTPTKAEIKGISSMANQSAFVAIRWMEGDYKEGEVEKLATGTLPTYSHSLAKGMESIKGIKVWAEETEQRDSNDKQVIRIIHRVAMPLDGGMLEVLISLQPESTVKLEDVLVSVRELNITNRAFFVKP